MIITIILVTLTCAVLVTGGNIRGNQGLNKSAAEQRGQEQRVRSKVSKRGFLAGARENEKRLTPRILNPKQAKANGPDPKQAKGSKKEARSPPGSKYGLQPDCFQDDPSRFNLCLDLASKAGSYQSWMEGAFAARDRWQKVILGDTFPKMNSAGSIALKLQARPGLIATTLPPFIDDLYVAIMDGDIVGSHILAQGGPTLAKTNSAGRFLPISGRLILQSSYLAELQVQNALPNLFAHEIGHVLGFGTLFQANGLHSGDPSDSKYIGPYGLAEWRTLGCTGNLPIETDYGEGTAGGHWDEACLDKELMTGIDDDGQEYLSRLTIAAMMDLGYVVNMNMADPFTLDQLSDAQCAVYCPEATGKFSVEAMSTSETYPPAQPTDAFSVEAVSTSETNPPTDSERDAILSVAAAVLQENRMNAPLSLPDDYVYIAGDVVTVYTIDSNGHIHGTTVTWNEVQPYLESSVVVV